MWSTFMLLTRSIDWDSYEAHAAFMNDPSYVPFGAEIKPLLSAPLSMIHVPLTPFPPTDAFQGPVVELATFNLKSGTVHSEFTTAFKGLHDACVSRPGCKGAAYGFSREDENQFIFIASWLSKEVSPAVCWLMWLDDIIVYSTIQIFRKVPSFPTWLSLSVHLL